MHKPSITVQGDWGDKVNATTAREFWVDIHTGGREPTRESVRFDNGKFESENLTCSLISTHRLQVESELYGINCDVIWPEVESRDISALDHRKGIGYSRAFDVAHPSLGLIVASAGHLGGLRLHLWGNTTVLRRFKDHEGDVTVCKFFPSGLVLLSGGADKTVQIYAVEDKSGKAAGICRGHLADITSLEIIGRGRNVVSSSLDGTLCLWDCGTQKLIHQFGELSIFSPIVSCTKIQNHSLEPPSEFPPDLHNREAETEGKIMACANADGRVVCFDLRFRQSVFEVSGCAGQSLTCVAGRDNFVAAGSDRGVVSLWDIRNAKEPLFSISRSSDKIESMVFDPFGSLWAGDSGGKCCAHGADGSVQRCISDVELGGITAIRQFREKLFVASTDYRMRSYDLISMSQI